MASVPPDSNPDEIIPPTPDRDNPAPIDDPAPDQGPVELPPPE